MAVYTKTFTGSMNSDSAYESMPSGDYLRSVNLRPYSMDGESAGKLVNIRGNTLIDNISLPPGDNTVIGSEVYEPLERIYYFVHNSEGHHQVWEFDHKASVFTLLIEDLSIITGGASVLNLSLDKRVTHINVLCGSEVDDLGEPKHLYLSWVYGAPHYMNVYRVKNGEYIVINEEVLSSIKYQPLDQIRAEYMWDPENIKNTLWGKAWRFRYRYIYKDGERSAWSPISKTPIPTCQYPSTVLSNKMDNVMFVNFKVGRDWIVDKVELAVSYSIAETNQWSSWYSFRTIDSESLGLTWQTEKFYGYEALTPIQDEESALLFDDVPLEAEAQEIINGNIMAYGNITRDFDLPEPDTSISYQFYNYNLNVQGGLAYEIRSFDESTNTFSYRIYIRHGNAFLNSIGERFLDYTIETGDLSQVTPLPGNYYKQYTYAPVGGGTTADIANGLAAAIGGTAQVSQEPYYIDVVLTDEVITRVASGFVHLNPNDRLTEGVGKEWDNYYRGDVGIAYRDVAGRLTSVIKCGSVDISGETFFPITTSADARCYLTINHQPPEYAHSFQIVRTKNSFNSDFLEWVVNVLSIDSTDAGTATVQFVRAEFDTKFPSNTVDYVPQKGDGVMFISNVTPGEELPVEDTPNYVVGSFNPETGDILIQGLDSRISADEKWRIRIYRREEISEEYYEFGEGYKIIDPGTPERRHFGNIAVQLSDGSRPAIIDMSGDVWRSGRMYFDPTGAFFISGPLQSPDMSDYFHSHINDDSRPNAVDDEFRRRNFPATIIHSDPINTESNINNISRFYPENSRDYDINFGSIKRLASKGSYLICYQEINTSAIPIEISMVEDNAGQVQYALSRNILNKARPYSGGYGIGDKPSSFIRMGEYFYHVDPNKGVLVRLAMDGMNPISKQGKMNAFFSDLIESHKGLGDTIIGGSDHDNEEAIFHFMETPDSDSVTISFSEIQPGFSTVYTYNPDSFSHIGSKLFTFKGGQIWEHNSSDVYNNFYGVQYESEVEFIVNPDPLIVKHWLSMALQTNSLWSAPEIETRTGQLSSLVTKDFIIEDAGGMQITNKEGVYFANILMDQTSPGGILEGDFMIGEWLRVKLLNDSSDRIYLFTVSLNARPSGHGIISA